MGEIGSHTAATIAFKATSHDLDKLDDLQLSGAGDWSRFLFDVRTGWIKFPFRFNQSYVLQLRLWIRPEKLARIKNQSININQIAAVYDSHRTGRIRRNQIGPTLVRLMKFIQK